MPVEEAVMTAPNRASKYYNQFLFNLCGKEVLACLRRLTRQKAIYRASDPKARRRMRVRGLFVAALTLNATAVWTAKLMERGTFAMSSQTLFFKKRWRQSPKVWGDNAKSCFARALSGYSIGRDAVCIDRHLERMSLAPKDASAQWKDWFRLYESMYGPGETILCIRWHIQLLDWIANLGEKPVSWK